MKPLRVCLDARVAPGVAGGIEQVVIGMASGLSSLADGEEEYAFLTHEGGGDWLQPYLGGACHLLNGPPASRPSGVRRLLPTSGPLRRVAETLASLAGYGFRVPKSDGFVESCGFDLMHFTLQNAFITSLPSIYHPHDLQHIHLPQFFSPRMRNARDLLFRTLCRQAKMVAVTATWGKQDLIRQYGLPEEQVQVVPLAPAIAAYPVPTDEDVTTAKRELQLPLRFIFYPAQTFAHKNHLALLDALALLRNRGVIVPFVSSGKCNDFFPRIQERIRQLRLEDQTRFLGFVTPLQLQCLYRLCQAVAIPTRFEAASFPIWEAFLAGAPVACSNVTSLPQQAGDAAIIFDPDNVQAIADAIAVLWGDDERRGSLVQKGRARVAQFTWERTARHFRAHYRRIAGRPLTAEDRQSLQAPPLL